MSSWVLLRTVTNAVNTAYNIGSGILKSVLEHVVPTKQETPPRSTVANDEYERKNVPRREGWKDIILLLDGTSVSFEFPYKSIISDLADHLPENDHQKVRHWNGAGTLDTQNSWCFMRLLDMAVGMSLKRSVIDAMITLQDNYRPGDRIILFGYSRGGYAARLVARFIRLIGIPRRFTWRNFSDLYDIMVHEKGKDCIAFVEQRGNRQTRQTRAFFVGVVDSVASIGIRGQTPIQVFEDDCRYFRHALSADESRGWFYPVLFSGERQGILRRLIRSVFSRRCPRTDDMEIGSLRPARQDAQNIEGVPGPSSPSSHPVVRYKTSLRPFMRMSPNGVNVDTTLVPYDTIQACFPGTHADLAGNNTLRKRGHGCTVQRWLVKQLLKVAPEIDLDSDALWKLGIKACTVGPDAPERPSIPHGPEVQVPSEFEVELRGEEKDVDHPISQANVCWKFVDVFCGCICGAPRDFTEEPDVYPSQALVFKMSSEKTYKPKAMGINIPAVMV